MESQLRASLAVTATVIIEKDLPPRQLELAIEWKDILYSPKVVKLSEDDRLFLSQLGIHDLEHTEDVGGLLFCIREEAPSGERSYCLL